MASCFRRGSMRTMPPLKRWHDLAQFGEGFKLAISNRVAGGIKSAPVRVVTVTVGMPESEDGIQFQRLPALCSSAGQGGFCVA